MSPVEMNLHRRFPDTITRLRRSPVDYDKYGDRVDAYMVETELRCTVQPIALEDKDLVSGAQLQERLKVYVPASSGDLRAASDDLGEADQVDYRGKRYVVEESRTWPKFTRATLLRES